MKKGDYVPMKKRKRVQVYELCTLREQVREREFADKKI